MTEIVNMIVKAYIEVYGVEKMEQFNRAGTARCNYDYCKRRIQPDVNKHKKMGAATPHRLDKRQSKNYNKTKSMSLMQRNYINITRKDMPNV